MSRNRGASAVARQPTHETTLIRRLLTTLPMVVVTVASVVLLVYAGYGETLRVYSQLRLERIAALGEVLQQTMETFTQTGLPVRQFTGFEGQARALADVDKAVVGVRVIDTAGRVIFSRPATAVPPVVAEPTSFRLPQAGGQVSQSATLLRLSIPVRDKFAVAASIVIDVDKAAVRQRVDAAFRLPLWLSLAAAVVFLLVELATADRPGRLARAAPSAVFVAAFLILSASLTVAMFNIYSAGVRGKTEALAQSIAHRLSTATELGLHLDSFSGLDEAFQVYRKIDPDIRWVALIRGGKVVLHTEPNRVGRPYTVERDVYEFAVPLVGAADDLRIAVALPIAVVFEATWRGGKNFVALFVACGLIALIFLPASRALASRGRAQPAAGSGEAAAVDDPTRLLAVLKAAYFLGVFVDALSLSFLPQWATKAAAAAGLSATAGSLPFTISFICLTMALLPAGRFAERGSLKSLMVAGIACTAAGPFIIFALPGFVTLCVGRGLSGVGQALLLVAVQSYGMAVASPTRRTQAVGIQVYAFSGGLICGSTIGGLLAALLGETDVFLIGSIVGLATVVYALLCIGDTRHAPAHDPTAQTMRRSLLVDLGAVLGDGGFLRMLFLGIVGKFVFAGIAMFAVPLILSRLGYAKEDIGQIMMLYALTILGTTVVASRLADRLHDAGPVLALGSLISGLGILLLGLVTATSAGVLPTGTGRLIAPLAALLPATPISTLGTLLIIVGIVTIGASQGMLAAPAITYVSDTPVAQRRGRAGVVAIYRLLERIGHISGPVVVGAALTAMHGNPLALVAFGLIAIAAAAVFVAAGKGRRAAAVGD
jgi:MFS family permease